MPEESTIYKEELCPSLGKVGCGGVWQLSLFKTEIYPLVGRVGSVIERGEQQISWHVEAQNNWVSDKIRVF